MWDQFFPLPIDKWITLQPASKGAKSYDYWNEVIQLVKSELNKLGIEIVQIGGPGEKSVPDCFSTQGQTTINQAAYLVKHGEMHLGVDSFAAHIASMYQKKIVCLYSNNHINNVLPYWTKEEDMILLEPDRKGKKPNFALDENPKTINSIRPETIAQAVFDLIGIDKTVDFETLFIGPLYHNRILEWVPDACADVKCFNTDTVVSRMDWVFNEQVLKGQFRFSNQIIITNKPFDINIAREFRDKIREVIYFIEEDDDPKWCRDILNCGVKVTLISFLPDEKLNSKKLDYIDIAFINQKDIPSVSELKGITDLEYRSGKVTISKGKLYPSKQGWLRDEPIGSPICPFVKGTVDDEFLKEIDYLYVKK